MTMRSRLALAWAAILISWALAGARSLLHGPLRPVRISTNFAEVWGATAGISLAAVVILAYIGGVRLRDILYGASAANLLAPQRSACIEVFGAYGLTSALLGAVPIDNVWMAAGTTAAPLIACVMFARGCRPFRAFLRTIGLGKGRGLVTEMCVGALVFCCLSPLVLLVPPAVLSEQPERGALTFLVLKWVLWSPVVEESVYRGVLYQGLSGSRSWATVCTVTSVAFMLAHREWSQPLVMGVGLCVARRWRCSLVAPITAHVLFNSVSAYMLLRISV